MKKKKPVKSKSKTLLSQTKLTLMVKRKTVSAAASKKSAESAVASKKSTKSAGGAKATKKKAESAVVASEHEPAKKPASKKQPPKSVVEKKQQIRTMAHGSRFREVVGGINFKEGENGSLEININVFNVVFSHTVASDILCEFLEVAFHNILYVREVYPQGTACAGRLCKIIILSHHLVLFEHRRKYSVPVWMCVHPELNLYIKDVLVATKTLISKGEIDKIVLAIKNKVRGLRNGVYINPSMC